MKFKTAILFTALMLLTSISFAESTGERQIKRIGCHLYNDTCYVWITGDDVGPDECRSTSIRWDKETQPSGKEMYSTLLAAALAKKSVVFQVDGCHGDYPTFGYLNVIMD